MDIPRPLRKDWVPDVFPQKEAQLEDTLDHAIVRDGFKSHPLSTELKSAMEHPDFNECIRSSDNLTASIARDLNKVLERQKSQIIHLSDALIDPCANCKEHLIMKPELRDRWFKDLAGTTPLKFLCTTVPLYSKKSDVLQKLQELEVPLSRAAWFVRVTIQGSIVKETQSSSRRGGSAQDVLHTMRKQWCSEMANELCQSFATGTIPHQRNGSLNYGSTPPYGRESPASQASTPNDSLLTPNPHEYSPEGGTSGATRNLHHGRWQQTYLVLLTRRLYDEGILDRSEWLTWLAKALVDKKLRNRWDIILHLVIQYIGEFAKCHRICVVLHINLQQLHREARNVQCHTAAASTVQQRVYHATVHLLSWIATACPDILSDQDAKVTTDWLHLRSSETTGETDGRTLGNVPFSGLLTPEVMQGLETTISRGRERRAAVAALTGEVKATHSSLCFLVDFSAATIGRYPRSDSVAAIRQRFLSPQGHSPWRLFGEAFNESFAQQSLSHTCRGAHALQSVVRWALNDAATGEHTSRALALHRVVSSMVSSSELLQGVGGGRTCPSGVTVDGAGIRSAARSVGTKGHAPHDTPPTYAALAAVVLPVVVAALQPAAGTSGARRVRHASLVCGELVRLGTLSVELLASRLTQQHPSQAPAGETIPVQAPSGETRSDQAPTEDTMYHVTKSDVTLPRGHLRRALLGVPLWHSAVPDSARLLCHVAMHGVGSRGRDSATRTTRWQVATTCAAIARVLNTDKALADDGSTLTQIRVPTPTVDAAVVQAMATAMALTPAAAAVVLCSGVHGQCAALGHNHPEENRDGLCDTVTKTPSHVLPEVVKWLHDVLTSGFLDVCDAMTTATPMSSNSSAPAALRLSGSQIATVIRVWEVCGDVTGLVYVAVDVLEAATQWASVETWHQAVGTAILEFLERHVDVLIGLETSAAPGFPTAAPSTKENATVRLLKALAQPALTTSCHSRRADALGKSVASLASAGRDAPTAPPDTHPYVFHEMKVLGSSDVNLLRRQLSKASPDTVMQVLKSKIQPRDAVAQLRAMTDADKFVLVHKMLSSDDASTWLEACAADDTIGQMVVATPGGRAAVVDVLFALKSLPGGADATSAPSLLHRILSLHWLSAREVLVDVVGPRMQDNARQAGLVETTLAMFRECMAFVIARGCPLPADADVHTVIAIMVAVPKCTVADMRAIRRAMRFSTEQVITDVLDKAVGPQSGTRRATPLPPATLHRLRVLLASHPDQEVALDSTTPVLPQATLPIVRSVVRLASVATLASAHAVLRLLLLECDTSADTVLRQLTGFCLLALSGTACANLCTAAYGDGGEDPEANNFPAGCPGHAANILALVHALMSRIDSSLAKSLQKMLCEQIVAALSGTSGKIPTENAATTAWSQCLSGFLLARAAMKVLGLANACGPRSDVACGHAACARDTDGDALFVPEAVSLCLIGQKSMSLNNMVARGLVEMLTMLCRNALDERSLQSALSSRISQRALRLRLRLLTVIIPTLHHNCGSVGATDRYDELRLVAMLLLRCLRMAAAVVDATLQRESATTVAFVLDTLAALVHIVVPGLNIFAKVEHELCQELAPLPGALRARVARILPGALDRAHRLDVVLLPAPDDTVTPVCQGGACDGSCAMHGLPAATVVPRSTASSHGGVSSEGKSPTQNARRTAGGKTVPHVSVASTAERAAQSASSTEAVILTDTLAQLLPSTGASSAEDAGRKRIKTTIHWQWFSTLLQETSKDLYYDRVHKSRVLMRAALGNARAAANAETDNDDEAGQRGPSRPALGIF
eukprot:m.1422075 g.1422075  ORF g.1422075 m.1422075 type:complete len:1791 (+) comp25049_c0_seq7:457-5829(+)